MQNLLIIKRFSLNLEGRKTSKVELRCPKCGYLEVEKNKNQEYRCSRCGEIFYFVTPECGSADFERYKL
jgi:predicted RNA-binding Zn-ribbon protein involved in translation (DUF1610 family)